LHNFSPACLPPCRSAEDFSRAHAKVGPVLEEIAAAAAAAAAEAEAARASKVRACCLVSLLHHPGWSGASMVAVGLMLHAHLLVCACCVLDWCLIVCCLSQEAARKLKADPELVKAMRQAKDPNFKRKKQAAGASVEAAADGGSKIGGAAATTTTAVDKDGFKVPLAKASGNTTASSASGERMPVQSWCGGRGVIVIIR
jgi:hypothetical protein